MREETGPKRPRSARAALGIDARDTALLKPEPTASFEYQHGALSGGYLSPQQFSKGAEFRQRKTLHVGGSTSIRYNMKGAFTISTSAGGGRASVGQGGHHRMSRSTGGFYQRKVRDS